MQRPTMFAPPRLLVALGLAVVVGGCGGEPAPIDPDRDAGGTDAATGSSTMSLRHVRRLSASQLRASLRVVTGEEWTEYERYAASLGEADHLTRLTEGLDLSVAFLRFAEDGARASCAAAVARDRGLAPGSERAILGGVELDAPSDAMRAANLSRLLLRFHGHVVTDPADPRFALWQPVLASAADGASVADAEAARWEAVCVGLAMHSDFLTY